MILIYFYNYHFPFYFIHLFFYCLYILFLPIFSSIYCKIVDSFNRPRATSYNPLTIHVPSELSISSLGVN